jgi:magnesium chelatase family protein
VISRVHSFVLRGIDAVACEIEVQLSDAETPAQAIVGLPDAAVRESIRRVWAAIYNSGFGIPRAFATINLAPANVRKEGPVYDLPIAVGVLQSGRTIRPPSENGVPAVEDYLIAGEVALDGRLRPIRGAISLAQLAATEGKRGVIVPAANADEAAVVDGIEVLGATTLDEVVAMFNGNGVIDPHPPVDIETLTDVARPEVDFADVRGQEAAKRAITVAAAGGHNMLMIGPAGTGKTMMAKALPGILPPLSRAEAVEVTQIYSCAGQLGARGLIKAVRPVRAPHHTASAAAIIGGGTVPRPGDVSLAHRGVLFLDELPEFARNVLETLRQPLEDGCVTIARVYGSVRFPAKFMLVAAMNPTPGGGAADDEVSHRAMERYLAKLSGPLVDRIDIHIEVPAVPFRQLKATRPGTDTETMRTRVLAARRLQAARQGPDTNAELSGRTLGRYAAMDDAAIHLIGQAMTELGLSARAYDKVRRIARTIADLDDSAPVQVHHVAEAIQYRLLDRQAGKLVSGQ